MEKAYVSNTLPELSIGGGKDEIRFRRGLFVTSDPAVQARLESNDWYGGLIQPRDGVLVKPENAREKVPAPVSEPVVGPEEIVVDEPAPGVEPGGVRQGARGTRR